MNNLPTRRAEAGEQDTRISTPLPQSDRFARNNAFSATELYKLVLSADDTIERSTWNMLGIEEALDWSQRGIQLRATINLGGVDHLVEVDTAMGGDDIDASATTVGIFDTRGWPHRYIAEVDEMIPFYAALRDAAHAEVQSRAVELIEAHEAERDEQRAESVRDFDDLTGIGAE